MKKLLLLLVFSASLFASAQSVDIVELTRTVSGTSDVIRHIYPSTTNVASFTYNSEVLTSPTRSIYSLGINSLELNGIAYSMTGTQTSRDWSSYQRFVNDLGDNGKWYNSSNEEITIHQSQFITDNPFIGFADTDWNQVVGSPNVFNMIQCGITFTAAYNTGTSDGGRFLLHSSLDGIIGNFNNADHIVNTVAGYSFFVCEIVEDFPGQWTLNTDGRTATLIHSSGNVYHAQPRPGGGGFIVWVRGDGNESVYLTSVDNDGLAWFQEPDLAHEATILHADSN